MATPLAELLRPEKIEDMVGQTHLFKKDSLFLKSINKNIIPNMIFYGPPGIGKTTMAKYYLLTIRNDSNIIANQVTMTKKASRVKDQCATACNIDNHITAISF